MNLHRPARLHELLLAPVAALYGAVVRARNRRYDRDGPEHRAAVPVISVGNLTVGGTGKTPIVAWLAERLRDDLGRSPAIVSRGYGGRAGAGPLVVEAGVEAVECGDEPWALRRTLPGVVVVVGSDRSAGARLAVAHGADVLLLDDGFQHRRLARDLDIVLLDARRPFGNRRLLPAGPLREAPASLARAGVLVLTRATAAGDAALAQLRSDLLRIAPGVFVLTADHAPAGFRDRSGDPVERPRRAVAFCGIGDPTTFREDLPACGVELESFRSFRDHHRYREGELRELSERARGAGIPLVTTEKDLARIGAAAVPQATLLVLAIRAAPREPRRLLDAVAGVLEE